jgi:hypothetical protein
MDTQGDQHDFSDPERFVDPSSHEIEDDSYEATDTKHPQYHSLHADLYDMREGK